MEGIEGLNVIIVEDMPTIRTLIENMLYEIGFKNVATFDNGLDAFDDIVAKSEEGNPYNLVLSDWNMPGMSGLEFLKKVRSNKKIGDLPFLMVTTVSEKDKIIEALSFGVSHYIMKPISLKDMESKISIVLKKHKVISSAA